jgi:hypothetical protein
MVKERERERERVRERGKHIDGKQERKNKSGQR